MEREEKKEKRKRKKRERKWENGSKRVKINSK
jgi:hypothetical protein